MSGVAFFEIDHFNVGSFCPESTDASTPATQVHVRVKLKAPPATLPGLPPVDVLSRLPLVMRYLGPDTLDAHIEAMIEHGVSAMILSPAYGDEALSFEALQRAGIPAMQVLRKVEMRTELFPFAAPDYPNGTRIATEHLLEQGAKRIAFVGGLEGRAVTQERMAGYLSAIESAGLEPHVLTGSASRAFGREAAHALAKDHPEVDAAVCFNDQVALGMISGCAEIGRNVGRDLRIVGFDDIEEAAHSWPPLSSVRCDIEGFGKLVAETILAWLENDKMPAPEIRTPVSLAIRGSSGETPAG